MGQLVSTGNITLLDLNDAIISGTAPSSPVDGTLWIDTSTNPSVLKKWSVSSNAWVTQTIDLTYLDPDADAVLTASAKSLSDIANDSKLTQSERIYVRDTMIRVTGKLIDINDYAPLMGDIDSLAKGEIYQARQDALTSGVLANYTTSNTAMSSALNLNAVVSTSSYVVGTVYKFNVDSTSLSTFGASGAQVGDYLTMGGGNLNQKLGDIIYVDSKSLHIKCTTAYTDSTPTTYNGEVIARVVNSVVSYETLNRTYYDLVTYCQSLQTTPTPVYAWNTIDSTTITIDPTTWRAKWSAFYNALYSLKSGITSKLQSQITQTASDITLKVSTTDYTGANIVSKINISPDTIKINSANINLIGAVTILSDISGNLGNITAGTINLASGNFIVDASGNVTVKGNIQMGAGSTVKADYITGGTFDGTNITVTNIHASSGSIGGFTLGTSQLYTGTKNLYSSIVSGVYIGTDGIHLGSNFKVDSSGNMTASSGTFSGSLSSATGTFTGSMTSGSINIGSGMFAVDTLGNLTANNATLKGSLNSSSDNGSRVLQTLISDGSLTNNWTADVATNGAYTASVDAWSGFNITAYSNSNRLTAGASINIDWNQMEFNNSDINFNGGKWDGSIQYNRGSRASSTSGYNVVQLDCFDVDFNINNNNLMNVNHITIADPGPGEGVEWLGGSGWIIQETDDTATVNNTAEPLQFFTGSKNGTRRVTFGTTGNIYCTGTQVKIQNNSTVTFAGYQSTGLASDAGGALYVGNDGKNRVWSMDVYNRTYTSVGTSLVVYITTAGTLGVISSAQRYKLGITPVVEDMPDRILQLTPKMWYDRTASEAYADYLTKISGINMDGTPAGIENVEPPDYPDPTQKGYGFIAEELEAVGLSEFVVYDLDENGNKQTQSITYDRLWVLLVPVIKDLKQRIVELEAKIGA